MSQAESQVKLNHIEKKIDKLTKQVEGLRSIVSEPSTEMLGADQLQGTSQSLDVILTIIKALRSKESFGDKPLRGSPINDSGRVPSVPSSMGRMDGKEPDTRTAS